MTPLNYASPGALQEPRKPTGLAVVLLVALTGIASFVALRMERLNAAAGSVLPKTEPGKWRFAASPEQFWREEQIWKTGDTSIRTRALTLAETQAVQAEIASDNARRELYRFLQQWGLLQHLIVFAGVLFALWAFESPRRSKPQRTATRVCLPFLLVAGALMFIRSYLGSLME